MFRTIGTVVVVLVAGVGIAFGLVQVGCVGANPPFVAYCGHNVIGALSTLRLVAGYNRVSQCSVRVSRSWVGANGPRCRVAGRELQALGSRRMLASLRRIVSASGVWPNLSLNPDAPRRRFAPSFVAPVSLVR